MLKKTTILIVLCLSSVAYSGTYQTITGTEVEAFITTEAKQHFAIIGDYGDGSHSEKNIAKQIKLKHPDFILTLGDNNYPFGCKSTIDKHIGKFYSNYIGNYKGKYGPGSLENRFYPSIGNHDWRALKHCNSTTQLPYTEYFTLPGSATYYDFIKDSIHFFVLDSDRHNPDGNSIDSTQYKWFKTKISNSTAPIKIVYFHHPPFSSGVHGQNRVMQWPFKQLGATFVLSGHEHDYERLEVENVPYIVNGVGGASLYGFHKIDHRSKYRYNKEHGYMMGYSSQNKMILAFYNQKNKLLDAIQYSI